MRTIIQGRAALVDLVLRSNVLPAFPPREEIAARDLMIHIKRAEAPAWSWKELAPEAWIDAGHGAYILKLDEADTDTAGRLLVLVTGRTDVTPELVPVIAELDVVPVDTLSALHTKIPMTTLVGQVLGLAGRPVPNAPVMITMTQTPPILLGSAIVCGETLRTETDGDGVFELRLVTGATVEVSIPCVHWKRTFVVPRAPVEGAPMPLFSVA